MLLHSVMKPSLLYTLFYGNYLCKPCNSLTHYVFETFPGEIEIHVTKNLVEIDGLVPISEFWE